MLLPVLRQLVVQVRLDVLAPFGQKPLGELIVTGDIQANDRVRAGREGAELQKGFQP